MHKSDEYIAKSFASKIERKKTEIVGVISYNLLQLFWEIGSTLNISNVESEIDSISKEFKKNFGHYFDVHNLKIMMSLSEKYSLEDIKQIAYFVSWEYLPELLTLITTDQLFNFINIIHKEALSPVDLRHRIAKNESAGISHAPIYMNQPLIGLRIGGVITERLIKEYLDEGSNFLSFIQLKQISETSLSSIDNSKIQRMIPLIHSYQQKILYFANTYFNNMFWEFGEELIESLDLSSVTEVENRLDKLIEQPEIRSSSFLNKQLFYDCIKFASVFKIPGEQVEYTKGLSWDEIKGCLSNVKLHDELTMDKTVFSITKNDSEYPIYNPSNNIFKNQFFLNFSIIK